MKKIFGAWILAMMFCVLPSNAQVKLGVKGGLNLSDISLSGSLFDNFRSGNHSGFFIGPMLDVNVPIIGIGVDAALLYNQLGVNLKGDNQSNTIKEKTLQVPINLKYTIGLGRLAGFYLAVGPQWGFNIDNEKAKDVLNETIDGDFVYLPFKKSMYNNNRTEKTKGIEWTLTPPQIKATKTSFRFTGAYMTTRTHTETPYLHQSDIVNSTLGYRRYGLFEQSIQQYDLCTANLTLIQRIPSIRMVFTLISEFNIYTKHDYIFANRYAIGWYNNKGKYTDIPEANRYDSQYDDLTRSTQTYEQDDPPFYSNFHIQIRKELKSGHSFSFFANNFWWYNPTYKNSISLSEQTLNSKISFGFSATFKL